MGIEWITLLLFGSMFLLLLTGFPISYGLGAIAMVFSLWLWGPESLLMGYLGAVSTVKYTALVCIPMFVFMGMMLYYSGIADDLYTTFQYWLAPVPGGLASATIGVCTMIAALVSSEAAGTLTMGRIALPLMRKRGYQKEIATGCIQAGAALGFLVPPSCIAILYAVIAKESIGRLFLGGAIPGLLLAFMYIVYITIRCSLQPHIAPPHTQGGKAFPGRENKKPQTPRHAVGNHIFGYRDHHAGTDHAGGICCDRCPGRYDRSCDQETAEPESVDECPAGQCKAHRNHDVDIYGRHDIRPDL